ncbi:MAG: aldo/keto reductase [Bacteroidales bacterium]|nr:aldo/keto reductase [Bacteroidales bacterium]
MDNKNSAYKGAGMSRREALKIMTFGSIGLAASGSILQSCKTNKTGSAAIQMSAPDGSVITTRKWNVLGEEIGLLGMGCMRLPKLEPGKGRPGELDQDKVNELFDYALEHGVNYFDTAPAYGDSERAAGVALSRHDRSSFLLATKMSNFGRGGQSTTLEQAKQMLANSLANLQTDYIDFYLLHALSSEPEFQSRFIENGLLDWLFEQKEMGVIRHIGFSFHGSNSYMKELLSKPYKWDFVQIQMNYIDWKEMDKGPTPEQSSDSETLYKMLEEQGIPVVVMEPVRGGALANVTPKIKETLAGRFPTLTPAGVALSFAASFPGVMCTLSGMSNITQLKENVATFTDFKPLDDSDNEFLMGIADLYRSNPHIPCTGCQYCMPCPHGVNIPGNFAIYNDASDELRLPNLSGPRDKEFKRNKKEFLSHYTGNLAAGTRADACTSCLACLSKCPQHIDIPGNLRNIQEMVEKL